MTTIEQAGNTNMTTIEQGSFKIEVATSQVTIGEGKSANNQLNIKITKNGGSSSKVRATLGVKCGNTQAALLAAPSAKVASATYAFDSKTADLSSTPSPSPADSRNWQTLSGGVDIPGDKQLSLSLSGFDSNTLPGWADIDVLVQVQVQEGENKLWKPVPTDKSVLRILKVEKKPEKTTEPKIHYFTVNPDYILHAGQTPVALGFYATQFKSIALYRNNQEVANWPSNEHPMKQDGSIEGARTDTPSITTVYRLEGKPAVEKIEIEKTRYRTVQVITPGWNQIALPQGYPTRLFVTQDFSGGRERLYGIFIGGDGEAAALYSSATGVDDWRLEPGEVPQGMALSPGVAYDNKLWLIGGSSVNANSPGSEVWCYEKVDAKVNTHGRQWSKKSNFPEGMKARMGHACVVFPRTTTKDNGEKVITEEIWVLGGYNNDGCFNDVWKFCQGQWEEIKAKTSTQKWTARLMHAAVCFRPDSPAAGEAAPPPEVYVYGGADIPAPVKGLQDLWLTLDGETWNKLITQDARGIVPPPGPPLAAALVATGGVASGRGGSATAARLFLGGTFLEDEKSNRVRSLIFESKRKNRVWQQSPVIDGWEQFEGGFFYMQAIAFNGFLFVWSLFSNIPKSAPPKLNILVPR